MTHDTDTAFVERMANEPEHDADGIQAFIAVGNADIKRLIALARRATQPVPSEAASQVVKYDGPGSFPAGWYERCKNPRSASIGDWLIDLGDEVIVRHKTTHDDNIEALMQEACPRLRLDFDDMVPPMRTSELRSLLKRAQLAAPLMGGTSDDDRIDAMLYRLRKFIAAEREACAVTADEICAEAVRKTELYGQQYLGNSEQCGAGSVARRHPSEDAMTEPRACTCHPSDRPPRPCPHKYAYAECVRAHAASLEARVAELEGALARINEIRNSIIGLQTINWSEHIYPLVAALNQVGIEGMDYDEARGQFGTMLERTNAAEDRADSLAAENTRLREDVAKLKKNVHQLTVLTNTQNRLVKSFEVIVARLRDVIDDSLDDLREYASIAGSVTTSDLVRRAAAILAETETEGR